MRATYPLDAVAVGPGWSEVTPSVVQDGARCAPAAPPAPDSKAYAGWLEPDAVGAGGEFHARTADCNTGRP